jgi:hypothetical protein
MALHLNDGPAPYPMPRVSPPAPTKKERYGSFDRFALTIYLK